QAWATSTQWGFSSMTTITTATIPETDRQRLARGAARMREIGRENERAREIEEAALLHDLGREPSYSERVIIEQLTALIVRGRRWRAQGRGADAEMVARLVMRGMAKLGIRQGPAKPSGPTLAEIAASYARPAPIVQTGAGAADAPADGARISG